MVSFAQVACSIATFVGLSLTGPVAAAEPETCPGLIASRDALFSPGLRCAKTRLG